MAVSERSMEMAREAATNSVMAVAKACVVVFPRGRAGGGFAGKTERQNPKSLSSTISTFSAIHGDGLAVSLGMPFAVAAASCRWSPDAIPFWLAARSWARRLTENRSNN